MYIKLKIEYLKDWNYFVKRPFIIAGPCGAESEDQIIETSLALAKSNINALRAGIWKPRTRPGPFEGVGEIGLKWIKTAGKITGLPVITEVANPKHVEKVLKAEIDMIWIGARTTVNPFMVEEIAQALKGYNIPVFVKNPVNPDLELWIGAIERLNKVGISKIAAIHRGFSSYEKSIYRNNPNWEIPIELKRRIPELPIICDPSHICGNREMLLSVSQTAMDLNFDGLMIESHINPASALTDEKQQITPSQLEKILSSIIYRNPSIDDLITFSAIEKLREKIDVIDRKILNTIAERMKIARLIGEYKKKENITILQSKRWDEIVTNRVKAGITKDLNKDFILKLFEIIHQEAIYHQDIIMNNDKTEI